jgi:hypothetical protein
MSVRKPSAGRGRRPQKSREHPLNPWGEFTVQGHRENLHRDTSLMKL